MAKIVLTRGIPGAGKSTWAKAWVQEDPERRTRVNRDELRKMLYGTQETLLAWQQEQHVSAVEKAIAKVALEKGKDVVVDAMNLRAKWVKLWLETGRPVEYRDFPISLTAAIERNEERGAPVPSEAIEKIYRRFTINGDLPPAPLADAPRNEKHEPDWSLPTAWIVDIDGTLARMVEGGRSPYDYTRVHEDEVHEDVAALVNRLGEEDHIIIVSGREDACLDVTAKWLKDKRIRVDEIYMRKAGDSRRDSTVKAEIFDQHIRHRFNVLGVFDDRNAVVRMWRDLGLRCYQVQPGDF